MSFACVGEALAPTFKSSGIAPGTTQKIRAAISTFLIIPYDHDVVERWARLSILLRGRLKGEGINDMWTAACALSHRLPVVTNNLTDFQTIQADFSTLTLVHPSL
jgi:predicted nucleic acid-binding protein